MITDEKVLSLIARAKSSGRFGAGKLFDYQSFSAFENKMWEMHDRATSVINDSTIASKQAFAPEGIVQLRQIVDKQRAAQIYGEAQKTQALRNLGIIPELPIPKAFDPENSALEAEGRRLKDLLNIAPIARAHAHKTATESWEKIKAYEAAKRSAGIEAQADDLLKTFGRNWDLAPVGKMSARRKKEQIDIISKGASKGILKTNLPRIFTGFAKSAVLAPTIALARMTSSAATKAQQLTLTGLATAEDPEILNKWKHAISIKGGGIGDVNALFKGLLSLRQGALTGDKSPLMEAARIYGVNLRGSGLGGWGTNEELLSSLNEWFSDPRNTREAKADLASKLGWSQSLQATMMQSPDTLSQLMSNQNLLDDYAIRVLTQERETLNASLSNLSNQWDKMLADTGMLHGIAISVDAISKGLRFFSDKKELIELPATSGIGIASKLIKNTSYESSPRSLFNLSAIGLMYELYKSYKNSEIPEIPGNSNRVNDLKELNKEADREEYDTHNKTSQKIDISLSGHITDSSGNEVVIDRAVTFTPGCVIQVVA